MQQPSPLPRKSSMLSSLARRLSGTARAGPTARDGATTSAAFFASHRQVQAGDKAGYLAAELEARTGLKVWFDMNEDQLTTATMERGVRECSVFLLFLSPAYLHSYACVNVELKTAILEQNRIVILRETDADSPPFIEGDFTRDFLGEMRKIVKTLAPELKLDPFESIVRVVPFSNRRGSKTREDMLTELGKAARVPLLPFKPSLSSALEKQFVDILVVGHHTDGEDACTLLCAMLKSRASASRPCTT